MADDKRVITKVDLDTDFQASVDRITELKAGRHVDDIPLHDEYWRAIKKHRAVHPNKY